MAAPKKSVIVLGFVLLALVALFVVGVVLGVGDGRKPPSTAERGSLRERFFGKPAPVAAAEVSAQGCVGEPLAPRFGLGATCQLQIAKGKKAARRLVVKSRDKVHVVFKPNGEPRVPIDVKLTLNKDNAVELSVDRDGAALAMTCEQPALGFQQPCVVTLD